MYCLHNPISHAHLDDLVQRLSSCLIRDPCDAQDLKAGRAMIRRLTEVVECMDGGQISPREAEAAFARHPIPNFSFQRWLDEMVEEGVYIVKALDWAA
jgi:hypothetical protein